MGARLESLERIEAAIWTELGLAAQQRQHPWRTPVLATVQQGLPQARTVVLREVDVDQRTLVMYSDSRSGKIAQLRAQPQAVLVCWSPSLGWQLRLSLNVTVDTAGLAVTSRWAHVKLTPNAQDYLSPLPPGTPLDTPHEPHPEVAGSPENFAMLEAEVESIDWLELHDEGPRRALFDAQGARWLQP